jgi:serine protease Do
MRATFPLVLILGVVTLISGCAPLLDTQPMPGASPASPFLPATPTPLATPMQGPPQGTPLPLSGPGSVRWVAERVKPAVVQIANEQLVLDQLNRPVPIQQGLGSGVIFDSRGYILTNNHVVAGAEQITVSLPDGRSFKATLTGRDPDTDLAVVKIEGANLPVANLGSSSRLSVGDWVVAIGNALGLAGGPTVTVGVVSALGRAVQEPPSGLQPGPFLFDLIQTDAAINPGNSGGPLVNMNGEVVGINTLVAGAVESGFQAQGIGFAIAIDTAKPIAEELISKGRVAHAYMGISYITLSPSVALQLGVQAQQGVLVRQVVRGSPAAQAGIRPGDIIVAVDGTKLVSDSDLARVLSRHKPGDAIAVEVVRDSTHITIQLTLGEKPSGQ